MRLDDIVTQMSKRKQRATYGAVAKLVGVLPRGLMNGMENKRCMRIRGWWPRKPVHQQVMLKARLTLSASVRFASALATLSRTGIT